MIISFTEEEKFTLIPVDVVTTIEFPNIIIPNGEKFSNFKVEIEPGDGVKRLYKILSAVFSTETGYTFDCLYNSGHDVNKHIEYLANYLSYYDDTGFSTKTIVVEHKYMSLSYLKDYANYYTLGYHNISKYCKRVHFFGDNFCKDEFFNFIIKSQPDRDLFINYFGNVVIKPLPNSLIGPTLIKPYKNNKNREFPALKSYSVNLFGKESSFKTLMFQEQDSAISACATVALWMCFNKISDLFSTNLPAPSEITKSAGLTDSIGRSFPTTGLEVKQIISAIDNLDDEIVSEVFSGSYRFTAGVTRTYISKKIIFPWKLKRFVYAYLRLEIPPLIGYNICKVNGNHLVAITGYRKEKNKEELIETFPKFGTELKCEADRIQRLFSHDDQLGPFSKIGFGSTDGFDKYIKVNWRGEARYELAVATQFIVPISSFIRITYLQIEEIIENFQELLNEVIYEENEYLIWNIYITKSNKYKEELLLKNKLDRSNSDLLFESMPQYIWVANLSISFEQDFDTKEFVFDLIFDATDTTNSVDLLYSVFFDENIKYLLAEYYKVFIFEFPKNRDIDSFNNVYRIINTRQIKTFFNHL